MRAILKSLMKPIAELLIAAIVASFSLHAIADDATPKDRNTMHKDMHDMTPEQRAEKRAEVRKAIRDHLESMTPEERAMLSEELNKERDQATAEQQARNRKELREHVNKNLSPEERKELHARIKAYIEHMHPDEHAMLLEENDGLTAEQRSENRRELREHVNKNSTPEERKEMHKRVQEQILNRHANPGKNDPDTKPAN